MLYNLNMCYINHPCGHGAVIKCSSHSNRDNFKVNIQSILMAVEKFVNFWGEFLI